MRDWTGVRSAQLPSSCVAAKLDDEDARLQATPLSKGPFPLSQVSFPLVRWRLQRARHVARQKTRPHAESNGATRAVPFPRNAMRAVRHVRMAHAGATCRAAPRVRRIRPAHCGTLSEGLCEGLRRARGAHHSRPRAAPARAGCAVRRRTDPHSLRCCDSLSSRWNAAAAAAASCMPPPPPRVASRSHAASAAGRSAKAETPRCACSVNAPSRRSAMIPGVSALNGCAPAGGGGGISRTYAARASACMGSPAAACVRMGFGTLRAHVSARMRGVCGMVAGMCERHSTTTHVGLCDFAHSRCACGRVGGEPAGDAC